LTTEQLLENRADMRNSCAGDFQADEFDGAWTESFLQENISPRRKTFPASPLGRWTLLSNARLSIGATNHYAVYS
jgi:hypothetical protein